MIRLLGLVLLAFLVWLCLEAVVRALRGGEERPSLPPPVALARCAACGVYFSRERALGGAADGRLYCSEECVRHAAAS